MEEARRQQQQPQSEGKMKAATPVEGEVLATQNEEVEEASPKTEPERVIQQEGAAGEAQRRAS
ncbi:hypothetical protein [Pendulispora albinea]|uniref:Uncharacterized protein n=1 Tax=Pendulispora albinea TaxID=2741071 RepID=A0ABZ2MD14_9BACT